MQELTESVRVVLGCRDCPRDRAPFVVNEDNVQCPVCRVAWPLGAHGSINSLINPTESVLREIDGMRHEHPDRYPTRESLMVHKVEHLSCFEDRIASTATIAKNYYLSTKLNFRHAYERIGVTGTERVLEIGAEHDYPFLQAFREKGCECYATNLFFFYEENRPTDAQVVLGDMNTLPYQNEMFDVVLLSATSHHSPDLPGLMTELARVTKPGAWVLLLNDPTDGMLKHALDRLGMGTKKGGDRHHDVNENEYTVERYLRLAKANGFDVTESFFSIYYDQKLQSGQVSGVRFATLAKLISMVWKVGPLRRFLLKTALYPGQMLIGLELNLILKKQPKVSTSA
jgi:SAM-dependent methyltransferase